MKLIKSYLAVASIVVIGSSAFAATAPSNPANPANVGMSQKDMDDMDKKMHDFMDQCDKKIQQAAQKDAKQDAQGQKKLDQEWQKIVKTLGLDPSTPDPYVYGGSNKDMQQDAKLLAKLNDFLQKHGCPTVSSFE